ncbi:hypothetical protein E2562_005322 [Oryza meyeriana var. granulata]|uniref:SAM-dependent methyltransferase Erg6/SMT-type domain-containing protein n=1 Tax=Oryza meyeriana var. granulata TaxID=110450 RepID=A0A6G1DDN5_9ORYZ|nr:hypothetical protein E2562_005322 [Oryza meyeriana var. granulata]
MMTHTAHGEPLRDSVLRSTIACHVRLAVEYTGCRVAAIDYRLQPGGSGGKIRKEQVKSAVDEWYGETLRESLKRHQHFLALQLGLKKGMKVLDVGCGIGGPLREIARFIQLSLGNWIEQPRVPDIKGPGMAACPVTGTGVVHGRRRPLRPVHGVAVAAALGRVNNATIARCGQGRRGQCMMEPRRLTLAQPAASEAHGQPTAGTATIVVADAMAVWGTAVNGGTAWSARRRAVGVLLGIAGIATTGMAPCGTWLR